MWVYAFIFIVVTVLSGTMSLVDKVSSRVIESLLVLVLVLFAGLRSDVGTDFHTYKEIFEEFLSTQTTSFHIEPGFYLMNWLAARVSNNFAVITLMSAGISLFFLFRAINSVGLCQEWKWVSYVALLCIGVYFVYLMSGIRQGISVAIFLYSIRYIVERKPIRYLALIFFGSFFHFSILLMIPMYWAGARLFNKHVVISVVLVALLSAFSGLTSLVFQKVVVLIGGHYAAYGDIFSGFANTKTGLGVLSRICFGLLIVIISDFWVANYRDKILYNLFSVGLVLYSFFLGVDILVRISEYLFDVILLILPLSIKAFHRDLRPIYVFILMIFLIALYYSNISYPGMNLIPYQMVL